MSRKILITGGAGFIGSTIADTFLAAGWDVAVIDDLSSGKRENVPAAARLYPCDVRSAAAAEVVEKERPDVLCHHAAQLDVRRSMADPRFDADVNVGGLLNLLQAAVKAGSVKQVLFASSGGATYGDTPVIPTPETHPQLPISVYGASKAASELYLGVYQACYGIPFAALRYANVYGPRQDPHGEAGVVAIFCGRLLDGKPCTIFGDGGQTRDYVYVGDVARANLLAAGGAAGANVGTGVRQNVLYRPWPAPPLRTCRRSTPSPPRRAALLHLPGGGRRPSAGARVSADGLARTWLFKAPGPADAPGRPVGPAPAGPGCGAGPGRTPGVGGAPTSTASRRDGRLSIRPGGGCPSP
jgi:UDP-glucose 4-epimerase